MKKSIITILLSSILLVAVTCGPEKHLEDKLVMHPFDEIKATFPRGPKPVMLYISESGCDHCLQLENNVFSRPEVAWFLNTNYYLTNIDIATGLPVTIQGKLYDRESFFQLFTNRVPNFVFFDTTGEVNGLFQGSVDLKGFKQLIKYVHNGHFGKIDWDQFSKLKEAETDTVLGVF